MSKDYAAAIVPGGTNIEARLGLAVEKYKEGQTPVIIFTGIKQGPRAKRYLERMDIHEYSPENGRGYIIFKKDPSITTTQNAYVARYLLKKFGIYGDLYLATEFHHSRALSEYKKLLPDYEIELETVKVIGNLAESLIRWTQAGISRFTDLALVDLPAARTDEEAYDIYVRDYKVEKILHFLRNLESKLYLGIKSQSQEKLKDDLISENGNLLVKH